MVPKDEQYRRRDGISELHELERADDQMRIGRPEQIELIHRPLAAFGTSTSATSPRHVQAEHVRRPRSSRLSTDGRVVIEACPIDGGAAVVIFIVVLFVFVIVIVALIAVAIMMIMILPMIDQLHLHNLRKDPLHLDKDGVRNGDEGQTTADEDPRHGRPYHLLTTAGGGHDAHEEVHEVDRGRHHDPRQRRDVDALLEDVQLALDEVVGHLELEGQVVGLQEVDAQLVEPHLDQELVVLPPEEGVAQRLAETGQGSAGRPQEGMIFGSRSRIVTATTTHIHVLSQLLLHPGKFLPDGNVVIELQFLRPNPQLVRYATGHEAQYDAHQRIDNRREEQQKVDLGKYRLDLQIEVGRVRVSQKDGEFDDAQRRQFAVHLLQHRAGEGTAVGAPVDFMAGDLDDQDEAEGEEGDGQDGVVDEGLGRRQIAMEQDIIGNVVRHAGIRRRRRCRCC